MLSDTLTRAVRKKPPAGQPAEGLLRSFEENVGVWAKLYSDSRYDEEADTETVVGKSLETLLRVLGADGCSISIARWNQEFLVRRADGRPSRSTHNRDTMIHAGCLGHDALRSGTPHFVRSIAHDPLHYYPSSVRENEFRSVVCFPLGVRGQTLGALSVYFGESRSLSPAERDLGTALAQSAALAIDHSLLVDESRRNYLSTVQALVRSLEARDSDTSYHSLRVTQYATVLGEKLDMSSRELRALQYGAMLHDIGKIGIINEILNKKGKLTKEEYGVMREHPLIGARIVETVDFLRDAVPAIRHHHEMFDGSGYPDHLAGSEIPLIARIVTVPDFYDALTTERPYRAPLDPSVVLGEIRKGSGKAFDPDIADLFLSIHERGELSADPCA